MSLGTSLAEEGTEYSLMKRYKRPFCDVNKTYRDDNLMCWAASVSNMVGFSLQYNPETAFANFKKKYKNQPKSTYNMLLAFFLSNGYSRSDFLVSTTTDNANFNKRIDLSIIGSLCQGRVVTIGVKLNKKATTGHALTVYGFETIKGRIYLLYVDSDDLRRKLYKDRINCKKSITMFTTGRLKGQIIVSVVALKIFGE